ncbi:MAG: hypothetical protein CVU43_21205 [Chloroflexi bacterium HGW-Chloroflexi-5]|nr:MAG: hypothetical protein CVU43_21205 [Chloroflexi bacterium HGW-Chloroflexi-5]
MNKTFQYRIYPTNSQRRLMESTIETCRRFYNDCLAERKMRMKNEKRRLGNLHNSAK